MRNGRGKIYGYERQLSTREQTAAFYLALAILTPYTSVVDLDLDPGWVKKSKPGSGMNIPDHISKSLFQELRNNFFGLKYLNSLMRIRIRDPEYF
jgi:hypothetical protein